VRWTVIDGYRFGVDYQRRASAAPGRLMVIDDTGEAGEYVCDLVLNQNPHASAGLYARRLDGTRLLLGLDYCLLRREFADRRPGRPPVPRARRILVLAGGGDDGGLLADALAWLGRVSRGDLEVRAIVGPLGPPVHEPGSIPGIELTLVHGSEAIADEMARADAAVTAAGSACWELAYMGVPSAAVPVADNQLPSARRSDDLGAFLVLDRDSLRRRVAPDPRDPDTERLLKDLLYDRRLRESLALRAGRLVDGRGAARVVDALLEEGRDP
jgi:spore coat polysaccharide biosynthesis predicted glycosyltransferase SpsG